MRVSVCIPTVNRIHYLREALASVAAQTFSDYEVVIADNSGDPAYQRLVRGLIAGYPRLRLRAFHHPATVCRAANANFLIDVAKGDYWIYLSDDDRLCPDCLASLCQALDSHPAAGFAFSDHWVIRPDGAVDEGATESSARLYKRCWLRDGFLPHGSLFPLALWQSIPPQSTLFRLEVLRSFRLNPSRDPVCDFDLQLRLAVAETPVHACYVPARLTDYRVHAGQFNASLDVLERNRLLVECLEQCGKRVPAGHAPLYRAKLAEAYRALAFSEVVAGERRNALAHFRKSLTLKPASLRTYFLMPSLAVPRAGLVWARDLLKGRRLRHRPAGRVEERPERARGCRTPASGGDACTERGGVVRPDGAAP
jgi:glycosyltransferase involved in cell wall biosynthesis